MVDAGNGNRLDRMAIASQGVRVLGHVPARMLGLALPRRAPGTRHACSRQEVLETTRAGDAFTAHSGSQLRQDKRPLARDWISVEDVKAKLWKALSDNVMQATGMERPNGEERVLIPDHEWCDLAPFQRKGRTVLLVRKGQSVSGASGYNDVMVRRQSVMALWPLDRREECDKLLPPTMSPDGPGYMPLYCAAQWIATRGGNFTFDPHHTPNWHAPYADLLARISSGEVTVTGVRDGIGGKLDPHLFASVRVAYPFSYEPLDLILSEDLYLASCAYINEEHWRAGSDDSLQNRRGVKCGKDSGS